MTTKQTYNPFDPTLELQTEVSRKRKLAEALMKLGLQGSGAPYTHPMQVLGQLAQALVGRQLDRRALKGEREIISLQRERLNQALAEMQGNITPDQAYMIGIRAGFPDEMLEPYKAAMTEAKKFGARPQIRVHNDQVVDDRNVTHGQQLQPKATDRVIYGPDGKRQVNPEAFTTELAIGQARGGLGMTPDVAAGINLMLPSGGNPGQNGAPPTPSPEEIAALQAADPETRKIILEDMRKEFPDYVYSQLGY